MSIPLLFYIMTNTHDYRFHQKLVSVTNSPRWQNADGIGEHRRTLFRELHEQDSANRAAGLRAAAQAPMKREDEAGGHADPAIDGPEQRNSHERSSSRNDPLPYHLPGAAVGLASGRVSAAAIVAGAPGGSPARASGEDQIRSARARHAPWEAAMSELEVQRRFFAEETEI
jgi:hypothetical protein